ncbi:MAG: hypothetical protein PHD13_00980 [Methanocellales archaeon]|nr:hypothetical protein [Methanocellales archaeon]MDD3291375.1 hypothetical protein [Methanocellales archaeon]MDD5234735.1 hypothetical protein [Methanocellales archaeon]MDD5484914.1 hypothetical protein [Methanocellales archaeon]
MNKNINDVEWEKIIRNARVLLSGITIFLWVHIALGIGDILSQLPLSNWFLPIWFTGAVQILIVIVGVLFTVGKVEL